MTMPNFLIIGAGRAGTTSLYYYLKQHPQIYMSPIKETNFFAYESRQPDYCQLGKCLGKDMYPIKKIEAYLDLFKDVSNEKAIGEASPRYLWHPQVAERIYHTIPKVKLIVVLRHPVERAYSSYVKYLRDGWEKRTFAQAINDEELGPTTHGFRSGQQVYVSTGFYYKHLVRFFNLFDKDQIAVYLFEEFKLNPAGIVRNIFHFLEVDHEFLPDMSIQYNASGLPKNKLLHSLLQPNQVTKRLKQYLPAQLIQAPYAYFINVHRKNLVKPALSPKLRQKLLADYQEDTLQLQKLIQRDLSPWLE